MGDVPLNFGISSAMYFGEEDESSRNSINSKETKDDFECNVICMSQSGKPIYARHGSHQQVARQCGLIQAIRTSLTDSRMNLGDIQSLTSGELTMVFMNVESITLLAVSKRNERHVIETEAYLRMQLEHVYGQILLTLTEQVQSVFVQNPNFDLAESLGPSMESLITEMLNDCNNTHTSGALFSGAVESVFPIAPAVRDNASRALFDIGQDTDNTVFALLVAANKKLISIVQPRHTPHQLSCFDLQLLLRFCHSRPGLITSELWFPICLSRFHSRGFLYAYTNCLDRDTNLMLVLVSQENSTQQFQLFRRAAIVARQHLGLPQEVGNVLRIINQEQEESVPCHDVAWKRSLDQEDYVDASLESDGEMIPYVFKDASPLSSIRKTDKKSILLDEIETALNPQVTNEILDECCAAGQVRHFLFRLDAPVQTDHKVATGKVSQCLSSSLETYFGDVDSRRRVYAMYQKLQLRMRLGSSTFQSTMTAFDSISSEQAASEEEHMKGISRYCPASCLVESPPEIQGVTYAIDGSELFLAMNGREFEVYIVIPSTVPFKQAATFGARLVRKILLEKKTLFLAAPLSWKT